MTRWWQTTDRPPAWVWMGALVPFLIVALAQWRGEPPGETTDVYQYLLHARALAEGQGYTETGYLFSDLVPWVGPSARPPGLPLTLLPVFLIVGPAVWLMQTLILAGVICYLVVAGRYFARQDRWQLGVGVTAMVGLVPLFPTLSTQLLNDLPFCMWFWLCLWVVDADGPFDLRRALLVTVLIGAAMAYRLAGVALVPALMLYGAVRFSEHRWMPFLPAGLVIAAGSAALLFTDIGIPMWVIGIDWRPGALVSKLGDQVMGYRFGLIGTLLYPFPYNLANDVYHVVVAPLAAVGLMGWARRAWRSFAFCAVVGYSAMLLVLPATQGRYLWPLVPFVLYGLLRGLVLALEAVRSRGPKLVPATTALIVAAVVSGGSAVGLLRDPPPPPLMDDRDIRQVIDWTRDLASEASRVAFFKPRLLSWETRVPAMAHPIVSDTSSTLLVLEEFRRQGITHVIAHRPELRYLDATSVVRAIAEHPARFEILHGNGTFVMYRLRLGA